jgi:hypothetical protein
MGDATGGAVRAASSAGDRICSAATQVAADDTTTAVATTVRSVRRLIALDTASPSRNPRLRLAPRG